MMIFEEISFIILDIVAHEFDDVEINLNCK